MHCLLFIFALLPLLVQSTTDLKYEFTHGLEGWGRATSSEMQASISHRGDQAWIDVEGSEPYVDSPFLNMTISPEQYLAIRYRHVGPSTSGKVSLTLEDNSQVEFYFRIAVESSWNIAHLHLEGKKREFVGKRIFQIRLFPGIQRVSHNSWEQSSAPDSGDGFQIDWIRLVRAPILHRVIGCNGVKYSNNDKFGEIHFSFGEPNNSYGNGKHYRTNWKRAERDEFAYASSFNCLRGGGENITIEGYNLGEGGVPATVLIDNVSCKHVTHDAHNPRERLTCITPPMSTDDTNEYHHQPSLIKVSNGKLSGLVGTSSILAYASIPPAPRNIFISNVASRSIDLTWNPGGKLWQRLICTGFIIRWREISTPSWTNSMVVGNVTTTSMRGLASNTTYTFGISSLNENQTNPLWWNSLDLYGRRKILPGALEGPTAAVQGHTLLHDVNIPHFNSSSTQNYGAEMDSATKGPTDVYGGEGHYGLSLVGSANIANCNSSYFCCDDYDNERGECRDHGSSLTCRTTGPSDKPFGIDREIGFVTVIANLSSYEWADWGMFNRRCGPSLRLTPSESRSSGAVWYQRQLEVGEGFDTVFSFEIANPSSRCNNMEGVYANCKSTGGDGFAFVIQGNNSSALGNAGIGLGYDGLENSVAVEFDTYFNHEALDPYENHISVHTRGWRQPNSSNHTYSIGHTNAVQMLSDGKLTGRIKYVPFFDIDILASSSFVASPHILSFFENNNFQQGGNSDWNKVGLGVLSVYIENLDTPVLSVPLHLSATLNLNRGRAYVGFTAATGDETHQSHEINSWYFSSLRMDPLEMS